MEGVKVAIGDFLGFVDMNGIEAIQGDKVQELEDYVRACNEAHNEGNSLVPDSIWDRLMEILVRVNPMSELCKYTWEDSVDEFEDDDVLVQKAPMYSIQTIKSFECDELKDWVSRLPDGVSFTGHVSAKLNGHGIRLKYKNGEFFQARSRARSSAGRDITEQLRAVLELSDLTYIDAISGLDLCEIRGEWVLPISSLDAAREFNPDIKSAFTAVSSLGKSSADKEQWQLLRFVAYQMVADGVSFNSKSEEYDYLQDDLGFEVPYNQAPEELTKESIVEELKNIISDCEDDMVHINEYDYYTDGIVFAIDDSELFNSLGDDGSHYKYGNIALKVGYWKQDMYSGIVQTILWRNGKTKLSPVAIVADNEGTAEFDDGYDKPYIFSMKEITNFNDLGVLTAGGNSVRRVPLYAPNNIIELGAYPGERIYFRYGGEAGVVPCYSDGSILASAKAKQYVVEDYYEDEEGWE